MATRRLLIADIGGTNARFALANDRAPGFRDEKILQCANFSTAVDAIDYYLDLTGVGTPDALCLAAAGPLVDGEIRLTNNPWVLSTAELEQSFGAGRVRLLNDFAAIGYSVPFLGPGDLLRVRGPTPGSLGDADYTIGVIGPGTGLGCVGLKRVGKLLVLISSEASHGGFAPESDRQLEILAKLRERFDRVSSENLASGVGIENLYWALAHLHGASGDRLATADVFERAEARSDPVAVEAVETFFEIIGQVAGDLALSIGAEDGIFIAGGIAQRHPEKLIDSRFRRGFEHKGSHRYMVERIPTQLITHQQPGLLGAAYCARELANA